MDWLAQQSQDVLEGGAEDVLDELLALNGSSADARPKAFIGFNRKTGHVIHGRQNLPKCYEPWLIKFANSQDGPDPGAMELVYSEMARQAGLMIPDTHLFPAKRGGKFSYRGRESGWADIQGLEQRLFQVVVLTVGF